MKSFACFLSMLSFCSINPAQAEAPYFPKGVFFRNDLELSDIVADHLSERLLMLEEPSLWKLSRDDQDAEAYRFFWWAAREEPISFRLTKAGDKSTLLVSQIVNGVGKDQKETRTLRTIALTAKQWDDAVSLLNKTSFWSAPTSVKESRGIGDGDAILIEAVKKGRYHVIDRQGCMTSESYKSFCEYLMRISGSPMINAWGKRRDAERNDPDYKREYKETEDTGAEAPYFPKGVFFRNDLEHSDFVEQDLGDLLFMLEEPSLWKLSRDDQDAEAYRFFWWAAREEPISFRLTKAGDKSVLLVSQTVPGDGKDQKETSTLRAIALTAKQWDDAVSLLNKTSFWSAPTSVKESRGIGDGDRIVIEAVKKGHYHVIDREGCTTSESYKSFCQYLMRISGSPMINAWGKRRDAERNDPDYKREYKETEDTGEIEEEK